MYTFFFAAGDDELDVDEDVDDVDEVAGEAGALVDAGEADVALAPPGLLPPPDDVGAKARYATMANTMMTVPKMSVTDAEGIFCGFTMVRGSGEER